MSPEVDFVKRLEPKQQHVKMFRCKGFPTHPTAFFNFFYATQVHYKLLIFIFSLSARYSVLKNGRGEPI
jgi:hypothetical protein